MKVVLLRPMMGRDEGDVMELPGGMADIWIQRGYVAQVGDDQDRTSDKMLRVKKKPRSRKRQVVTK